MIKSYCFLSVFYNAFSSDFYNKAIIPLLEGINIIVIILLTVLAVIYAKKTYKFESKSTSTLLCRLTVVPSKSGFRTHGYALEIYNNGNTVAQNLDITINDNYTIHIDYIKPEESFIYTMGEIQQMADGKTYCIDYMKVPIYIDKGKKNIVSIKANNSEKTYELDNDAVLSFIVSNNEINEIEKSIGKIERSINNLTQKISQKK
ncbi:MAG: hypothetical protein MJ147_08230 [Clostridia bacterium]|nr:hypothetical protein [Clostridia bacterium]